MSSIRFTFGACLLLRLHPLESVAIKSLRYIRFAKNNTEIESSLFTIRCQYKQTSIQLSYYYKPLLVWSQQIFVYCLQYSPADIS